MFYGDTMKLLEPITDSVEEKVKGLLSAEEEILIIASSDLNEDGDFGGQWVAVTDRRILVLSTESPNGGIDVPMSEVTKARTEPMVGGSRLEIERRDDATVIVPYSNSQAIKFSEVARGIEQVRKGETLLINTRIERVRCPKCGRLLPERDGVCPACVGRLDTLSRIGKYLKPYRLQAIVLAAASVIMTVAELIPPMITRYIVDDVLLPREGNAAGMEGRLVLLGLLVLGMVVVRVLSWGAEWAHGWIMSWLGAQVTADIRSGLYRRMEMLTLQFYDKRQVGGLVSRVTRDSGMLQDFLVDGLPYLIINALMILGILGFLFWMSWGLGLYILLPLPLMIMWGMVFWKRMRLYFNKWGSVWSSLTERTKEALSGIRVIKAFAQERREMEKFHKFNSRITKVAVETELNRGIFFSTMTFLTGFGVLVIWLLGGREVLADKLTLGTLMAFYYYMWLVYGPLEWFAQVNAWMSRAFAGAERIFEIIDTTPESYGEDDAAAMPHMKGRVAFQDVTFGYDKSKPVLHEVDLDVKPGEMIGLVGKSGVGKTTTVNLICRFYDVDRGGIKIDGVDIREIRLEDLRSQIGIVLQEPFLFSGTIAENISYGKPGASFEEIVEVAKISNAHSFIVSKPDGYDTQVGERGNNLSGGEKQRVSIARSILHNPKILILDEATSSVDVQTEKGIQEAIAHLVEGRTTFAIAHRLSTLRNATRLVVLDAGRIVEVGSHSELMERKGVFYNLVQLQQQASEIMAVSE